MILPVVQQASHFHPFQPFLSLYHQPFFVKRLCIGLSKHFLVILSMGRQTAESFVLQLIRMSLIQCRRCTTVKSGPGGMISTHDLSQLFLNHYHLSKRNNSSGRRGILQLPRSPTTANSFRKMVGLKEADGNE